MCNLIVSISPFRTQFHPPHDHELQHLHFPGSPEAAALPVGGLAGGVPFPGHIPFWFVADDPRVHGVQRPLPGKILVITNHAEYFIILSDHCLLDIGFLFSSFLFCLGCIQIHILHFILPSLFVGQNQYWQ